MWSFQKYRDAKEVQRISDAKKDDLIFTVLKKWINCGVVSGHQPRLFIGLQLGHLNYYDYYVFQCQNCALKITKTASQLSSTERDALIKLGYKDLNRKKKNDQS